METVNYDGEVERWKVDLIASRARRMGFRTDEIPDIQQQIILDVMAFRFDAAKSNGAKESTALQALIDNHLKNICRASARYQSHLNSSVANDRSSRTLNLRNSQPIFARWWRPCLIESGTCALLWPVANPNTKSQSVLVAAGTQSID